MLRTRLWMGAILIALTVGMLGFDQAWAPWHPFQFAFQTALACLGSWEIIRLFGNERRLHSFVLALSVVGLTVANFVVPAVRSPSDVWLVLFLGFAAAQMATFIAAMAHFRQPGDSVDAMARTVWGIGYLALLPSFLAQLRWLYPAGSAIGTNALALAIFVPKSCDIGAYFTGKLLGRHRMTPILSPKKTWEGAAGGLTFAAIVAIAIDSLTTEKTLDGSLPLQVAYGLVLGATGMAGDLAESLIKRDCEKKDASETVPGFGGVLDVVDAIIFAAPVAWLFCALARSLV